MAASSKNYIHNNINAFDALCELASKESWCWKVPCSTCGNYDFRYAFLQLADGKHPSDPNWMDTAFIENHKIYAFPHEYTHKAEQAVLKTCLESSLMNIGNDCKFPDWLGYIGVVMSHMRPRYNENQDLYNALSKLWGQQMQEIIPKTSLIYARLENGLSFSCLSACERALNGEETKEQELQKRNNLMYQRMLAIIEERDDYSDVRIDMYSKQSDVDMLDEDQQRILSEKLVKYDKDTPLGRFKAKYFKY
jgi:hypothetical protein